MKILKDIFYTDSKTNDRALDVYIPDEKCKGVFLYIHGGGIENGDKSEHGREGKFLTDNGYGFVSINYRMFPNTKFPEFLYDAAEAAAWLKANINELFGCDKIYVGGSSAGGYISMMLCFDSKYLASVGLSNADIAGYWHDAGQVTAHFTVLKHSGTDSRRIIVDERAPVYFVGLEKEYPPMRFTVSDNDMFGRYEQTLMMLRTMEHFKYSHFDYKVAHGKHCQYINTVREDGTTEISHMILDFLDNADNI